MRYKSILTVVLSPKDAEAQILAAAKIAEANDGHLDILALGIDHTQAGYSYIGAGAVLMSAAIDRAEQDARAAETAAKAAVAELPFDVRWSIETVASQVGSVIDVVANAARFADLVVLPLPYGAGRGLDSEAVIEAAMFEGERLVAVTRATLVWFDYRQQKPAAIPESVRELIRRREVLPPQEATA